MKNSRLTTLWEKSLIFWKVELVGVQTRDIFGLWPLQGSPEQLKVRKLAFLRRIFQRSYLWNCILNSKMRIFRDLWLPNSYIGWNITCFIDLTFDFLLFWTPFLPLKKNSSMKSICISSKKERSSLSISLLR